MLGQTFTALSSGRLGVGTQFVSDKEAHWKQLLALLVLAPLVTGCGGASNLFQSDLLSKDAEWFSRPGRLFIKNVSIETPPLTPDKAVTAEDLVSADGGCPGMAPADANALSDGAAGAPPVQSGRWRSATPNATSCAASAHPTTSISPITLAVTALPSSTGRVDRAPASTPSPPGA